MNPPPGCTLAEYKQRQRIANWLRLTGLPPPDMRPPACAVDPDIVPRVPPEWHSKDDAPEWKPKRDRSDRRRVIRKHISSDESGSSFDDIVRLLEEREGE